MSWLLRQARPYGGEPADVLVADGVVAAIGEPEDEAGRRALASATVIEAEGLVLLPGLVDLHTHLREPGREDAETVETGTRAAESAIAPSSASLSPARPTVTAPTGRTSQ